MYLSNTTLLAHLFIDTLNRLASFEVLTMLSLKHIPYLDKIWTHAPTNHPLTFTVNFHSTVWKLLISRHRPPSTPPPNLTTSTAPGCYLRPAQTLTDVKKTWPLLFTLLPSITTLTWWSSSFFTEQMSMAGGGGKSGITRMKTSLGATCQFIWPWVGVMWCGLFYCLICGRIIDRKLLKWWYFGVIQCCPIYQRHFFVVTRNCHNFLYRKSAIPNDLKFGILCA